MSDDFSEDVSEENSALVNHAVYLRGNIITSYAPLTPYREGIQPALDELLNFEELRHFIAHGLLIVTPMPPSDALLQYRLYRTTKQGTAIAVFETSASDLDDVALKIGTLLHEMLTTFRRIYFALGFELED